MMNANTMKNLFLLGSAFLLGLAHPPAYAGDNPASLLSVPLPKVVSLNSPFKPGADFLPLGNFELRLDSAAPNAAATKLELLCTLRNRSQTDVKLNGALISAIVTDADGIGMISDASLYQPNGAPILMQNIRPVAPGQEITVRLLVVIPEGGSALKSLTFWEDKSQPQTIDLSGFNWPGAKPPFEAGSMKLNSGQSEFQPCGDTLDVRFDGFRRARSGWYEAFFTFKNTSDSPLRQDVLDFNSSALDVFTLGNGDRKQRYDSLMHANGEKAMWIPRHYAITAGGEAHVRYTFTPRQEVPNPTRVRITDRVSKTTLEWSVSSR